MLLLLASCVLITPEEVAGRNPVVLPVPTPPPDPADIDADGDGYTGRDDCDDEDRDVHPGATELPNQKDDDCDGLEDEGTIFFDDDGDGFCEQNPCAADCGLSDCSGDCDDTHDVVYPGAPELCDGLSNDCNFDGDEFDDRDGDGWSIAQGDPNDLDITEVPTDVTMIRNSVVCNIVRIPAGSFTMGCEESWCQFDEGPEHDVTVTYDLLVMETEVLRFQWERFVPEKNWAFPDCGGSCPVTRVSWEEAQGFADAINDMLTLPHCELTDDPRTCTGWRLPTEAEWEWAARQNRSDRYAGGSNPSLVGWIQDNAQDTVHPARLKTPTPDGLFDMTGNVSEWVWDAWAIYPFTPVTDPVALSPTQPEDVGERGLRGGNARSPVEYAHVTVRSNMPQDPAYYQDYGDASDTSPNNPLNYHGFRLVRKAP
ncbi:MAG: SUMF1/EgtB/PvdO family nonheme iron enzyme [Alphaproteobacteria bacterium]|nr:SUMF1/EgtB/PvdO family nonheme iron enzyme [Alphaproteobacteria bacterium]